MDTKTCTKCKEMKPRDAFHVDKNRRDGLQSSCKACNRAYRDANVERIKAQRKEYWRVNAERLNAEGAIYYRANTERIKDINKVKAAKITRSYVANRLKIPAAKLTDDLYEAYKAQLELKRLNRELNNTLKGLKNEQ